MASEKKELEDRHPPSWVVVVDPNGGVRLTPTDGPFSIFFYSGRSLGLGCFDDYYKRYTVFVVGRRRRARDSAWFIGRNDYV